MRSEHGRDHPIVTVNLDALTANYALLAGLAAHATCAAVVKADGYGLGAVAVTQALASAGCRRVYVASIEEALTLRQHFADLEICVFAGLQDGGTEEMQTHNLIPVMNDLEQVDRWAKQAGDTPLPAVIHLDTGMNRLGLPQREVARLAEDTSRLDRLEVTAWMSHLACADDPDHPMSAQQNALFQELVAPLPQAPLSLANSAGVFLGAPFRHNEVRPGLALYGAHPVRDQSGILQPVATVHAPILQERFLSAGEPIGYGATYTALAAMRVITVACGYADGLPTSLSGRSFGFLAGQRVPMLGRVSMDSVIFDVTTLPLEATRPGQMVELMGPNVPIEGLATLAGRVPYEMLTGLGPRVKRRYVTSS